MLGTMITVLGVTVATLTGPTSAPAGIELSAELRALTDRLLEDMRQQWYMFSGVVDPAVGMKRIEEAAQRFDQSMQELARVAPPEVGSNARKAEAREIRAKLIAIAIDRAEHPDLHAEIDQTYIHCPLDWQKRVPEAPFPSTPHMQDKYRLAWEYWLLRPGCDSLIPAHGYERVLFAIRQIGNPASLLAIEHCYLLTCREVASPRQVHRSQLYLLRSLAGFKTEDGLRTVLRCLAESEKLPYKDHPDYTKRWRWNDGGPAEHVARLMSEPAVRAKWAEILQRMDRSALPNVQRGILDRLERSVQQASRPAP